MFANLIEHCCYVVCNVDIVTFVYYYFWNTDQYFEFCTTDFIIYIFSAVGRINDTSLKSINLVKIKLRDPCLPILS